MAVKLGFHEDESGGGENLGAVSCPLKLHLALHPPSCRNAVGALKRNNLSVATARLKAAEDVNYVKRVVLFNNRVGIVSRSPRLQFHNANTGRRVMKEPTHPNHDRSDVRYFSRSCDYQKQVALQLRALSQYPYSSES
jgi:hypothetical protein